MSTWIFEPGHTEAEFRARHMMVTWVRGLFKDIRGSVEWDRESFERTTFEGRMDAARIWTGEEARDEHLRSADFFDVETPSPDLLRGALHRPGRRHPLQGGGRPRDPRHDRRGAARCRLSRRMGDAVLGGCENRGTMRRIGFEAATRVDRHDFGVSWNDQLPGGGVVVSDLIDVALDVEAILLEDLEATGAIDYYREIGALPQRSV
jgi:hypothetical protein